MKSVVGVFTSRAGAEQAVKGLRASGIPEDKINLLVPGVSEELNAMLTSDTEQPGVGKAFGGLLGGAFGAAGGMHLGAAAASLLIPGVGPVLALGVAAAALVGTGGALAGAAVGQSLEDSLTTGLPKDELFVYEDALRKGRTIIILLLEDELQDQLARQVLLQVGAESLDAARESWWLGLRHAEEEQYVAGGGDFQSDELIYRRGFESAQMFRVRGQAYRDVVALLRERYPEAYDQPAFRRGYERGQEYYQRLKSSSEMKASTWK